MAEKVTVMVLKVDLQCPCCYKKVKKILCKFPQIRDQVFNEKANTVTITVVCCDPQKIRDKLCCQGAKVIKSIEIKEPPPPPKPKEPEKPKQPEKPKVVVVEEPKKPEKPKEPEKPKVVVVEEPKKPEKPKVVTFVEPPKEPEKPKEKPPPPPPEKPKDVPKPDPPKVPVPAPAPTPPLPDPVMDPGPYPICGYPPPVRTCCGQCSEGYGGGPCYFGFGVVPPPPPPQPHFEGYYGYGYHERPCHVTRCDYYFSEENPQSCSIM